MYGSLLMTCPVQSPWPESCLMLIHTPETSGSPYSWLRAVLCSSPGRTIQWTKMTFWLLGSMLLRKSAISEEPSFKKCTYVSDIKSGLDPQARDHRTVVQEFQHLVASHGSAHSGSFGCIRGCWLTWVCKNQSKEQDFCFCFDSLLPSNGPRVFWLKSRM